MSGIWEGTSMVRMDLAPPRFLRLRTVMERTTLGKSQIYRLMKLGLFPRQYDLGTGSDRGCSPGGRTTAVWLESEITAWILGKVANQQAEGE
jgi:prophage regulatory protein